MKNIAVNKTNTKINNIILNICNEVSKQILIIVNSKMIKYYQNEIYRKRLQIWKTKD